MDGRSVAPRWLILVVAIAIVAGIAFAFWFYAFLSGPPIPQ